MKRIAVFFLCLMLLLSFSFVHVGETAAAESKGKVVILATGGTIAGVGEAGKTASYKPGSLTVEELLSAVPELEDVAEIEAIQICNVNSDDMTAKEWITLANTINEMASDPEKKGLKEVLERFEETALKTGGLSTLPQITDRRNQ